MTGAATAIFPRELVLASAGTGKTFRISNMGDETDETIAAMLKAFDAALAETPRAS